MVVQFGPFALDPGRRRLMRGATTVHLTPKAFDLLQILVDEAPRVVDKRELHERLWRGTFVSDATLVGLVKELRRALDDRDRAAPIIRTLHRVGYAFCPNVVKNARPRQVATAHWLVLNGRRTALHEGDNLVGRHPASAICLDAPGVSRSHARVVVDGDMVRLSDCGSKNGTTINGRPLSSEVELRDGDRIGFGSSSAVYRSSIDGISTVTQSGTTTHGDNDNGFDSDL